MIHLLPHGETIWNVAGRVRRQKDSSLTPRVSTQADRAKALLALEIAGSEEHFEIHVSPLGRTKETATRISWSLPPLFKDESRRMEVMIGSWDGLTYDEIDAEYPAALVGANADNVFFRFPDSKTFDDSTIITTEEKAYETTRRS